MASSKGAVLAAIAGNSTLTVAKGVAFLFSGSGSMLSEAIHSFADTANQILLFVGINKSERPADALFHYGYGGERYLYSLLSAVGIFVLGCGVTVYHGIHTLLHPPELELSMLSFAVLGAAFVIEGAVLWAAIRAASAQKGDKSLMQFLKETTDPTIAAVLLEDAVACGGVLIAAGGIWLAHITGNPMWDALGAITIGLMLGGVAIWLGVKNRTLILGPSLPTALHEEIKTFMAQQEGVEKIGKSRSRIVGAGEFRFTADVDFDGRVLGRRVADQLHSRAETLGTPDGREEAAAAVGEAVLSELAGEVKRIEIKVKERFPDVKYMDLEAD